MQLSQVIQPNNRPPPARILHLEDSELDQELVRVLLKNASIDCEIVVVLTREEFVRHLSLGNWDLILADYSLPSFDGMQALEIARKTCPTTPFIFLTGTIGEDVAVESLISGATDYVLKQHLKRLVGCVRRALNERAERMRRLQAEANLKVREEQFRFLAYHDSLTNLPNRVLLQDRLMQALSNATRRSEKVAILFIDLDQFKIVNDTLGHSAGDQVLKQVAERLERSARSGDTVARLGGDEFLLVVNGVKDTTDAAVAADRVKQGMAARFTCNGTELSTTCSIGISIFPEDGSDSETLLKNADSALFNAKDNGRNQWRFFTPEMNRLARERFALENALRQGLAKEQFFLEYQPQFEVSTGRIVGAEALLRWRHPEEGRIPPNRFIPFAESTGEIIPIGAWALRTACAQARQWQVEGMPPLVMAVNVSAVQLRRDTFIRSLQTVLNETGLAPQLLELEVTESLLLSNADLVVSLFESLGKIGSKLAIDDFGTGYCGFSYLRRFQFSRLKIDQSFVRSVATDPREAALTATIINMANILGMKVIAECVETEEQVEALRSLGCDQFQGYYFSRPLSAAAFAEKLRAHAASLAGGPDPSVLSKPQRGCPRSLAFGDRG